ncbi:MAG: V8-like Glu-specific endopeptidase, partial [Myxococcota bacterium]
MIPEHHLLSPRLSPRLTRPPILAEGGLLYTDGDTGYIPHESGTLLMRVVTGPRVIVGLTNDLQLLGPKIVRWPWRLHGRLKICHGATVSYGTGILISPRHVLTAAHCVCPNGEWADEVLFDLALDGAVDSNKRVAAARLTVPADWPGSLAVTDDIAMLELGTNLGSQHGWMGMVAAPDSRLKGRKARIGGYGGGAAKAVFHRKKIKKVWDDQLKVNIDTVQGQSGAPLWLDVDEVGTFISGVLSRDDGALNVAVRITPAVL